MVEAIRDGNVEPSTVLMGLSCTCNWRLFLRHFAVGESLGVNHLWKFRSLGAFLVCSPFERKKREPLCVRCSWIFKESNGR